MPCWAKEALGDLHLATHIRVREERKKFHLSLGENFQYEITL